MAETVPPGLIAAHTERLRRLDPLLSVATALSDYEAADDSAVLLRVPGAVGLARRDTVNTQDIASLFGALTRYQLQIAWDGSPGSLDLLIGRWAQWVRAHRPRPLDPETEAAIRTPARDTTAARVLLAHGLTPAATVAIRPAARLATATIRPEGLDAPPAIPYEVRAATPVILTEARDDSAAISSEGRAAGHGELTSDAGLVPDPPGVTIRRATLEDAAAVLDLAAEEMEYESGLSQLVARPNQRTLMRPEILESLRVAEPWTWIASEAGRVVGVLRLSTPDAARWIVPVSDRQPAAYLSLLSVTAGARGRGIGAALVRRAHGQADTAGMAAILLHYGTFNPLSVPFWSRMGYRPLWSIWQVSPVDYLR